MNSSKVEQSKSPILTIASLMHGRFLFVKLRLWQLHPGNRCVLAKLSAHCCRDSCVIISVLRSLLSCLKKATCICRFCRQNVRHAAPQIRRYSACWYEICCSFIILDPCCSKCIKKVCSRRSYITLEEPYLHVCAACILSVYIILLETIS